MKGLEKHSLQKRPSEDLIEITKRLDEFNLRGIKISNPSEREVSRSVKKVYLLIGLHSVIGLVYLLNTIKGYYLNNKEMLEINLLRVIKLHNKYSNHREYLKVQEIGDKYLVDLEEETAEFSYDPYDIANTKGSTTYIRWLFSLEVLPLNDFFHTGWIGEKMISLS